MNAGARKTAGVRERAKRPGSPPGGGAAATGGSAVMPPALNGLLLVGRLRGCLQLLLDALDVAGLLQELLEQPPLALTRGRAERRRLVVGHVEGDRLRRQQWSFRRPGDRVRIALRGHVVIPRAEAALLRPDCGGLRRREVLDERADGRRIAEGDHQV